MKSRAAVLWEIGKEWDVVDMDIDGPGPGEVLLKTKVAGMCHSDEHVVTGDMLMAALPVHRRPRGRRRGARGRARRHVGGTRRPRVMSFIPSCGRCKWCVSGKSNLCDLGATCSTSG